MLLLGKVGDGCGEFVGGDSELGAACHVFDGDGAIGKLSLADDGDKGD